MNDKKEITLIDDKKYFHPTMDRTRDINKTDLVSMIGNTTECTKCPFVAPTSAALVVHFKENHKFLCFMCDKPEKWDENDAKATWQNDHCRKNHRDGTLDPRPIICSICKKSRKGYKNENGYYKHLQYYHDYHYAMERARYGGVNPLSMQFARRLLLMPNVTEIPREVLEKHAALNPHIDSTPAHELYIKEQTSSGDVYLPFTAHKVNFGKNGCVEPKMTLYKKQDIPPGATIVQRKEPVKRKQTSAKPTRQAGQQKLQLRSTHVGLLFGDATNIGGRSVPTSEQLDKPTVE